MFDLKNIDFIKTDEEHKGYSFVGLKRKENSERLEFWLPLGFDTFETEITNPTSFDRVKNFFFKMYRTFQTYKVRKLNQLTEEEKTKDRDGVFEFENGFSFVNDNNEHVVFYGKLNALDKILEGYDELRISSLEKKQVRSHEIDYSKIHKYMHQAIYLDDDVIYLDEMNIAKNVLIQDTPLIIQLFCFIYAEIKKELEELDTIPDKAFELSDLFKENYLQPDSSLFAQDTFADTINILKSVFEEIDSKITYKDEDFWHFYDAIEAFLMGERLEDDKGIYFGISNFYDIWEDMCQSYILSNSEYLPQVLFADVKGKLLTRKDLGLNEYFKTNPFLMQINNHTYKRFLKPDLVLIKELDYGGNKMFDKIFRIKANKQIENQGNKTHFHFLSFGENVAQQLPEILLIYNEILEKSMIFQKNYTNTNFKGILSKDLKELKSRIAEKIYSISLEVILRYQPLIIKIGAGIIDYKYMRQSDYQMYNSNAIDEKGENKIKEDIHKQLIYEWTVQQNFENSETTSEFWIPYYSDNSDFEKSKFDITDSTSNDFKQSKIKLVKINFKTLQENYVKLHNAL